MLTCWCVVHKIVSVCSLKVSPIHPTYSKPYPSCFPKQCIATFQNNQGTVLKSSEIERNTPPKKWNWICSPPPSSPPETILTNSGSMPWRRPPRKRAIQKKMCLLRSKVSVEHQEIPRTHALGNRHLARGIRGRIKSWCQQTLQAMEGATIPWPSHLPVVVIANPSSRLCRDPAFKTNFYQPRAQLARLPWTRLFLSFRL